MTQLTPAGFLALPDEVIQSILFHIPPQQIPSVQLVCSRFVNVTAEPLLWRHYCVSSFRWWDKIHRFKERLQEPSSTDWRRLYADRHRASRRTQRALDRIFDNETGRLDQLHEILEASYDVKGTLLDAFHSAKQSDKYLAQRYWSHAALGCLHRMTAIEQWLNLKYGEELPDTTERSFGALDMFLLAERNDGDIDDIFSRLDSYVVSIRTAHPDIDSQTPRQKATTIAQYLLEHKLTGIQDDRDYYSLDHLFLGVALFSNNHNSVPLIAAIIYSYIARQFNLSAQPVSYPFHVHVLVHSPPGIDLDGNPYSPTPNQDPTSPTTILPPETTMYMDPFSHSSPIPLSHLQSQLNFIAPRSTPTQQLSYLTPSTPRDLTIRAAHNILRAPQQYSGPPLFPIPTHSATYAALFALVVLPSAQHPAQLRQHLAVLAQHFLEHFDLDVHIFETYILPLTTSLPDANAYRALMRNIRDEDRKTRPAKRRTADNGEENENSIVKYRVGQVFRHRRRQYLAVIYGWDPYCKMQEEWIAMNQVDRLSKGRGQPFYNVLVDDESTRYVAEENVNVLMAGEMGEDEVVDSFPIEIGKWFKRFDVSAGGEQELGRFVSNVKGEYPDD